jgi:hypothetical protein
MKPSKAQANFAKSKAEQKANHAEAKYREGGRIFFSKMNKKYYICGVIKIEEYVEGKIG